MSPRRRWLGRLALALGGAVALGWLPYQAYRGTGLAHLMRMRRELTALRTQNQALRVVNARLRADLTFYEEDPTGALERAAREELGLVKPGEVVFRIEGTP